MQAAPEIRVRQYFYRGGLEPERHGRQVLDFSFWYFERFGRRPNVKRWYLGFWFQNLKSIVVYRA